MQKNIFNYFLYKLKVKHTSYYATLIFNEHPNKYNLLGLSDLLTVYGVDNNAFILDNKEDISKIPLPFIAYAGGDLVTVDIINKEQIGYLWNGKHITVAMSDFFKIWSGIVLVALPNLMSGEPDYQQHKKEENLRIIQNGIIGGIVITIFIITCFFTGLYHEPRLLGLLFFNIIGTYISYLLILKYLQIGRIYSDKICSFFKQTDCNNLLESDAASLFRIVSWSEIGFSYFISNIIIMLLFPNLNNWLAIINICALPYSFWSIWYQKYKFKQWCPLCLIVQIILWILFFVNLSSGLVRIPDWDFFSLFVIGCIYFLSLLSISKLKPLFVYKKRITDLMQQINSLKANKKIFTLLLENQPKYNVSYNDSQILLGNSNANVCITILTNPHCNPCAKIHKEVNKLLKHNKHIQVQYIFSSFSPELDVSALYLIAVYLRKNKKECERIYNEWFSVGKFNKEVFFKKNFVDIDDIVINEFNRHKMWKQMMRFHATPTILINGYKLPSNYHVEDLRYFTNLDPESE